MQVNPIRSNDYPTNAKRPLKSRLSKNNSDIVCLNRLPKWENSIERYLKELNIVRLVI